MYVSAFVCLHCKGCYAILLLLKRVVAMSIHERIREIRQALGLSQAKFAKDISAALVEALAQASTAAVSYNLADGGPNITSPGQTGEAWKSGK